MSVTNLIQLDTAHAAHHAPQTLLETTKFADQEKMPVLLPDMFVSFLAQKPRVNPHYATIKAESEAWMERFVSPIQLQQPYLLFL